MAVDSKVKRRRGPASSLIEDRDERKYAYFDEKANQKNALEAQQLQAENMRARESLTWDKEKYEREELRTDLREEKQMVIEDKKISIEDKQTDIEDKRVQIQIEQSNHALAWERE